MWAEESLLWLPDRLLSWLPLGIRQGMEEAGATYSCVEDEGAGYMLESTSQSSDISWPDPTPDLTSGGWGPKHLYTLKHPGGVENHSVNLQVLTSTSHSLSSFGLEHVQVSFSTISIQKYSALWNGWLAFSLTCKLLRHFSWLVPFEMWLPGWAHYQMWSEKHWVDWDISLPHSKNWTCTSLA